MPAPIVLIVDDDADVLRLLRRVLDGRGDVVLAMNVEMAKACLSEGGIDVVVTDYNLPDATGVDLLTWLKQTHPSVRRVLTSAGQVPALEAGLCDVFLAKPSTIEQMRTAVFGPART